MGQEQLCNCAAAVLHCSPPTALRLLEEFVRLEKGDTIVQNGANSNVGKVSGGEGVGSCRQREWEAG